MTLPSKELLSEVLGVSKYLLLSFHVSGNKLHYLIQGNAIRDTENTIRDNHKTINIYELMHLMKVWANNSPRFIEIFSTTTVGGKGVCCTATEDCGLEEVAMHEGSYVYEDTEVEVVTKTCEWILKQGVSDESIKSIKPY